MAIETCKSGARFLGGPLLEAELSHLLTEAKEAHTRYEKASGYFADHSWEDWYARFIFDRLAQEGR